MKRHTTISFEGTREEVVALRVHAIKRGTTVGELVREALQSRYPSFFESGGTSLHQTEQTHSKNKKKSRK